LYDRKSVAIFEPLFLCVLMANRLFLGVLFFLTSLNQTSAQTPLIQLSKATTHYPIGLSVAYLEDPSGTITLADIQATNQFVPSQKRVPSFGFSTSVYWFRFRVRSTTPDPEQRWLLELGYSHFRTADLYIFTPTGQLIETILAGNSRGNQHRPFATHNYVFPLRLVPGQERIVYLRCDGMASKLFPLNIYEQDAFYETAQNTSLWLGFYFGFLAITILYHFLFFLYNQSRSYLLFSAYLFTYLLNELIRGNGNYIERLVLVYHPFWQEHVVDLLNGVIVLGTVFLLRFYSIGLQLESTNWMRRVLVGVSGINVLVFGILLTGFFPDSYSLLFNFMVPLVSYLSIFVISLIRVIDGYRPAWYYFWATLMLFAGIIIVFFERAGWLAGTSFWQHNAIQIASIIEIILLSLGFAESIQAERRRRKLELEVSNLTGRKSEREWLSLLLHTSFSTTLSGMLFQLSQIDTKQQTANNNHILTKLYAQLNDALAEVRMLSHSLPPTLLDEKGLSAAFEGLVLTCNARNQVQFYFTVFGEERRLPPRHEFEVYLIGLELINNVLRHADATSAWLELRWESNKLLSIQMRDDGKGFGPVQVQDGYGLASIRRLVQQHFNGTVDAINSPDGGALVTIQMVIRPDSDPTTMRVTNNPIRQLFGAVHSYF
jgi:two-component system, sensor histidine kinase LadS